VNPARLESDRVGAVRDAAAGWRRAGAIDDAALKAILDLFPKAGKVFGPILTGVVFLVSSIAVWAVFGAFALFTQIRDAAAFGAVFLVGAAALAAAAEALLASGSLRESGAASAAAFWAAVFAVCGVVALAERRMSGESLEQLVFGAGTAAFAAAAWRWGWPLLAGASAFSLFLCLSAPLSSRPLLVLFGAVLAGGTIPFLDRASLPRARRESAHAVLLVSLLWTYVLANLFSVESRFVEELFWRRAFAEATPAWRFWSAVLTGVIPAAVLAWGLVSRRRTVLGTGILMAALSLATLRHYVHLAPAWLVLAGAGALLVAGAVALERWLGAGPGRERFGFTAEPLFEDEARQQALGVIVTAATLSPEAAPRPAETGSRFTGGGGDSGGGGASESF
jgi:hypothetical protein